MHQLHAAPCLRGGTPLRACLGRLSFSRRLAARDIYIAILPTIWSAGRQPCPPDTGQTDSLQRSSLTSEMDRPHKQQGPCAQQGPRERPSGTHFPNQKLPKGDELLARHTKTKVDDELDDEGRRRGVMDSSGEGLRSRSGRSPVASAPAPEEEEPGAPLASPGSSGLGSRDADSMEKGRAGSKGGSKATVGGFFSSMQVRSTPSPSAPAEAPPGTLKMLTRGPHLPALHAEHGGARRRERPRQPGRGAGREVHVGDGPEPGRCWEPPGPARRRRPSLRD